MDESVRDFKRYFKKSRDPIERVEFILSLEKIDSPDVAKALLPILKDKDPGVLRAVDAVLAQLPSENSRQPFLKIFEKGKAGPALSAGLKAAARGGWYEYRQAIRGFLTHKDADARLWSAVYAGKWRDGEALPLLFPLVTGDASVMVRVAGVDALKILGVGHENEAAPALLVAIKDKNLSVATAACLALQKVRHRKSIPVLLDLWESGEGRLLESIYPTLLEITDLQFSDDPAQWRRWWKRAEAEYKIPTPEELAVRAEARAKTALAYVSKTKSASFAGIDTPSREVVFVVDVSGSMEDLVIQRDHFRAKGHDRFTKIDIIKRELAEAIAGLGPEVRFNVHAFASTTYSWRKNLLPANALNKRSAREFVGKLVPLGGAATQARAAAGLKGSSGSEDGRTNTWRALIVGLGLGDEKVRKAVTKSSSAEVKGTGDTLFFFSDGLPTVGEYVNTEEILGGIRELNQFRRLAIHSVAIGDFKKEWMRRLAAENGGRFVDLGR